MMNGDYEKVANLYAKAIPTFTTFSVFSFNDLIRYAIVTGNNTVEKSEGIIINGNSVANIRGIQVNTNSSKVIVSNNASRVDNKVSTDCTVVNNVAIV